MQPLIAGDFRMEGDRHFVTLPHAHDRTVRQPSDHINPGPHVFDHWCPDEGNCHGRAFNALNLEVGLERIALGAKSIALNDNVETPERFLTLDPVLNAVSEHDHPGARTKGGHAAGDGVPEGGMQAKYPAQLVHHTRLTTGNDETVDALEMLCRSNLSNVGTKVSNDSRVFSHIPLEREYADREGVTNHVLRDGAEPANH